MSKSSGWFEVDREGLRQLIAERGPGFIACELLQNAWDERVRHVSFSLHQCSRGKFMFQVEDDCPEGFADLRHAFTLFAPSAKKVNPEQRGRFNLGEKLVLSLAERAVISTVSGTVIFDRHGRTISQTRREKGSLVEVIVRMTKDEAEACRAVVERLLPPHGIRTEVSFLWSGTTAEGLLGCRHRDRTIEVTLPTLIADAEGNLIRTRRKTSIELYDTRACGEEMEDAYLYEMGIPVVQLDGNDRWHLNVLQKVPLNMDRDNVTPAYLRELRVAVLNAMADQLTDEQATDVWVTEASEDARCSPEAITAVVEKRFGELRVSFDPSDPEANALAFSKGYTVIPGRTLTPGQWENARQAGAVSPAGKVTPSPKVLTGPDGVPAIGLEDWSPEMKIIARFVRRLGELVLSKEVTTSYYRSSKLDFTAAWDRGVEPTISFNLFRCEYAIRRFSQNPVHLLKLIIHEFAHQFSSNHLSEEFYDALTFCGAKIATVIAEDKIRLPKLL